MASPGPLTCTVAPRPEGWVAPTLRAWRPDELDELATRAAAGDRAALDELLAEIQPRVRRICGRMLLFPEDAEEAAQDALLLVATKIHTFARPQPVHHLAARRRLQQRPVDVPHA